MSSEAKAHTRARSSLAAVHLFPAIRCRAKTGNILEVDGKGRCTCARNETDDNAVGKGAGPIGVDLTGHGRGRTRRPEYCGCFP